MVAAVTDADRHEHRHASESPPGWTSDKGADRHEVIVRAQLNAPHAATEGTAARASTLAARWRCRDGPQRRTPQPQPQPRTSRPQL